MSQLTLIAPLVVRVVIRDGETRTAALERAAAALADGLDSLCHAGDERDGAVSIAARAKVRVSWEGATAGLDGESERPVALTGVDR